MKNAIKKFLSIVLTALLLLTAVPLSGIVGLGLKESAFKLSADATRIADSAACGENLPRYSYNSAIDFVVIGTKVTSRSVPDEVEISVPVTPGFVLESDGLPDEYGFITVDLYAENCVGMTSFNFSLHYDPAVMNYYSYSVGSDAAALRKMADNGQITFNSITFESRHNNAQLKLNGYFGKGLYSTEHFVTLNKGNTINSNHFHLARVYFAVADMNANAQINATAIFDFEGFSADGFTYPAYGLIRNITAQMNVAIRCAHPGETELRNAVAATCGTDGYTGDTYCLGCETVVCAGTVISATGEHTWDSGVITTAPTYTANGIKTYTCSVCGNTKTESVDKLIPVFTENEEQAVIDDDGDILTVWGTTVVQLLAQASEGSVMVDASGRILASDELFGTGDVLILPDGTEYIIVLSGDLHGDGRILADDARTALRKSVKLDELNETQMKAADVDGDGEITSADARSILRASVGLDDPVDWFEKYS